MSAGMEMKSGLFTPPPSAPMMHESEWMQMQMHHAWPAAALPARNHRHVIARVKPVYRSPSCIQYTRDRRNEEQLMLEPSFVDVDGCLDIVVS
jgi:hypothetical protein